MSFTDAVQNTHEIAECLRHGLQALKRNSRKIEVPETPELKGSVDIDACVAERYPNDPRWDYVFGYKDRVYYIEIHPAGSAGEVKNIIAKLKWLKQWRKNVAKPLEDLKHHSTYHWISSGKTGSNVKRGKYRRTLAQNGIRGPDSMLRVDSVR